MKKIISLIVLIVLFISFKTVDAYLTEDRDYDLNAEMVLLVHDIDEFKKQHGEYPKSILEVRESEELCVRRIYSTCRKVFYKPLENGQDFRLALHSFSDLILWYKRGVCLDEHEPGAGYWFCAAYPEGSTPGPNPSFPVYREDKEIFENPDEWPVL